MKAWIISDIHSSPLDLMYGSKLLIPEADICVCAGDISGNIERTVDFLHAEIAPHMPVVATLGNHDYYGSSIDGALAHVRKWTAGTNVHILENETFRLDDLRVVGATLWTDFEIEEHDAGHLPVDVRREFAIHICRRSLVDFFEIRRSSTPEDGEGGLIAAAEMISRHKQSRTYIDTELEKPFNGATMVLTHHAPSAGSLDPKFQGHVTNAAFASDLSGLIHAARPHFWVHGHIHRFADYVEGDTRVLCNPLGYHRERGANGFRPGFVVETTVEVADD